MSVPTFNRGAKKKLSESKRKKSLIKFLPGDKKAARGTGKVRIPETEIR